MAGDFDHWDETFAEIDKKVNQLVRKTAFDIEATAKRESRVRYGYMRNAWYVRTEDSSDYKDLAPPEKGYQEFPEVAATPHNEAWIVGGARHTVFNEYGTHKMAAQPMLTPAVEQARQPFLDALEKVTNGEGVGSISEFATIG